MTTPADASRNRVFISCGSEEFEKPTAPFPGLRSQLRHYLTRADCEVKSQEDFRQTDVDTVEKLADYIRKCAAVIHLIGENPGAVANAKAVAAFLAKEKEFLAKHPEARAALGDCSDLTYTQWEAFLALHYEVPLFIYATDKADAAQAVYLKRLRECRKYPGDRRITDSADLFGQLIGDIHTIIASVPKFTRKIAPSRILKHAPDRLFGREKWLAALDEAWQAGDQVNVYTLVAWGGVGKTALVAHWVASRFHTQRWPGVERYFDWSFYSQGTGESRQTASDVFIQEALRFFDDPDPLKGSPWERGERLAGLISRHRTLLVLDGIEPLQYPPSDPQAGRLKDQALEALIQGLAADNPGLCVITTREHLANIESLPAAKEHKLDTLLQDAAVALLRHLQLVGTEEEMIKAWDAAGGHALTLRLLGRLIARAYGKDVRKWREVKFEQADKLAQGRSATRVMQKYEEWLRSASTAQQLELAVLRLTGLFDRPMSPDCFAALRRAPAIPGLTEPLVAADAAEFEAALDTLVSNDLLTHGGIESTAPVHHSDLPLDAHPLIREYFARQLRETQPEAFREAHSRLFDHLCRTTPHRPDTLEGLQPLYQAVIHGCLASRQQEACGGVYVDRILRGTGDNNGFYSTKRLGAFGADLAAVAAFFDEPWDRVSAIFSEVWRAWLLNAAAVRLRALGRLTEALQPMRVSGEMDAEKERWTGAAISYSNLSELELTLGRLTDAVTDARQAIAHSDHSGDAFWRMAFRTTAADALHQSGQRNQAGALFVEAERMQKEQQPEFELLYSAPGFRYSDWLLAPAERAAWQACLRGAARAPFPNPLVEYDHAAMCAEVERRSVSTLKEAIHFRLLLDIACDHLTLARVGLIRAILTGPLPQPTLELPHVAAAVSCFRGAGQIHELPNGLLTDALYHFVRGEHDLARARLDEAQQIAERGPMPLHVADVHLHRGRMFRDRAELSKAAKLIRELGYGRRYEELADAEEAAKHWSAS